MSDSTNTALSRRQFLRQATAGSAAAAAALTLTQTDALAISPAAMPASLDCSLPNNGERRARNLLEELTKLSPTIPEHPGIRSVEAFIDAEFPTDPSDEDAVLLIGAFYLKLIEMARVPLYAPSNEQILTWLEDELPIRALGTGYFDTLLQKTKDQIKADPRLIEVYHTAYYQAISITEPEVSIAGPNKKSTAYKIGYALGVITRVILFGPLGLLL